ncbi:MAG: uracil-DNA glycosylase [Candidatus Electrothrix sp. GW3-4]|uniref:uracil-DNA glycosylase n=1 Tax=Candidatus Electrothrix sp. GW3-4 TaxID=3126740 RepID=UPI0030D4E6A6
MSAQKNNLAPSSDKGRDGKIDPAALALLTGQCRHLLAFYQEMGLAVYPAVPMLQQFLTRVQKQQPGSSGGSLSEQGRGRYHMPASGQQQGHQPEKSAPPPRKPEQQSRQTTAPARPTAEAVAQQLEVLNQELGQCRCCTPDSGAKIIVGQGSPTPRLLVVGDCFFGSAPEKDLLWGEEEDAMLWRMMQAIGLDKGSVYVTNALKCSQPKPVPPGSLVEQSCFSHVEKELQIIRPRLICALGDTATRALLRTKAPLVRLRGRFHPYRSLQGDGAKIMPTFHPRLLLQYPEMKQATWKDLQAVQRMLQASSR